MPTLLVFLKAPVPGKVKTRLAKDLGAERAATAYVEMARAIRDGLLRLDGIRVQWVYAPDPAYPDLRWLDLPDVDFWRQGDGDLGRRLTTAFARAFQESSGPVCVIGMDSPGLPVEHIREAFLSLRAHDLAIGPTEDGGYYLLGLAQHEPDIFRGIPWSSDKVFGDTRERGDKIGLKTRILPRYYDVDTLAEYQRWQKLKPA